MKIVKIHKIFGKLVEKNEDIKKGIIVAFAIDDEEGKIGVAIGVTNDLTDKYYAVELVKVATIPVIVNLAHT